MVSVSDILKILDKVPIWKTLTELPKRVASLEERIAALEAGTGTPKKAEKICEICGEPQPVIEIRDHPTFGALGKQERIMRCANGHERKELIE